jgi:hypothetical protein
MGDLIQFPSRGLATPVATVQSLSRAASGRWLSAWDVDDWGRDDTLVRAAAWLSRLRWTTTTHGVELLPESGPAVIVVNTGRFRLTQWWVALTLSAATGRPVRFVGRSDVAPMGALARRLGGLLERPDEVAGALRDGQVLVVGLSGTLASGRIGSCDPHALAPAVDRGVPVFPAAVALADTSRSARIEIGPAIRTHVRRGPLGVVEVAEAVEARIGEMLATPRGA